MIDLRLFVLVFFIVIFVIGLLFCCENGLKDICDYYFLLWELEDGLVYEYELVYLDFFMFVYWYYWLFIQEEGVFLIGIYYEYDFVFFQLVCEELVCNGMLVQDVYLYEEEADSFGQQNCIVVEVLQGSVFFFEVMDSLGVFLYKICWVFFQDSGVVFMLVKNWCYLKDIVVQVLGENYDVVVFDVWELFFYDKEGVFEQEYGGCEIYVEGIGLVYYDKKIGGSMVLSYVFKCWYFMNEFEEQYE